MRPWRTSHHDATHAKRLVQSLTVLVVQCQIPLFSTILWLSTSSSSTVRQLCMLSTCTRIFLRQASSSDKPWTTSGPPCSPSGHACTPDYPTSLKRIKDLSLRIHAGMKFCPSPVLGKSYLRYNLTNPYRLAKGITTLYAASTVT